MVRLRSLADPVLIAGIAFSILRIVILDENNRVERIV